MPLSYYYLELLNRVFLCVCFIVIVYDAVTYFTKKYKNRKQI